MKKTRLLLVFWCFFSVGGVCAAAGEPEASRFPSLLSGIRISGPLDFCGEAVPLADPEVRERLEKEMLLSLWDRAQVILWIKRSGRYFPVIEKRLRENGLPEDLKYVAVVESGLRAHAGSAKGAIGFWQFMKATGKKYGLTINRHIDERRNIFTATEAAIRFFKKLYGLTGSWALAAAAYNMGERGLLNAVKQQELRDYYRLYLPLETQRYVLKALAVKRILSSPARFGFHISDGDLYPPLAFDRVTLKTREPTRIQTVAKAAGTYYKKIKDLNPQIRGRYIPAGTRILLVPKGAGRGFQQRLDAKGRGAKPVLEERFYVVKKGDSLSGIAKRFNVPLRSLAAWNRLNVSRPIHPGDRLLIHR